MKKATVTRGVIVERVGEELMVVIPGNSDVVSLSGRPAEVLADVQAGKDVDPTEPALQTLSDLGIVTSPGMSRRGLIKAGAIGTGAGIAVMAMPSVAAASSQQNAASSQERLSGSYDYDAEENSFYAEVFHDFPSSLGDGNNYSGNIPTGPVPGPLLGITGLSGTFEIAWETSGNPGERGVIWVIPDDGDGNVNLSGTGDILTSFVWDSVTYLLRLQYGSFE